MSLLLKSLLDSCINNALPFRVVQIPSQIFPVLPVAPASPNQKQSYHLPFHKAKPSERNINVSGFTLTLLLLTNLLYHFHFLFKGEY